MNNINPKISVVILTHNEEKNIASCLKSCSWCDDVHVLDSGSVDRTRDTAREHGALVHLHPFESFGKQRNWAIDQIATKYCWHFYLDADERFTSQLVDEMNRCVLLAEKSSEKAAYFVPCKLIFMKRWLRFSGNYPTFQVRLIHKERCRFADFGHGQREDTKGEINYLTEPYLHFNFSKGLSDWIDKHNRYSTLEAHEALNYEENSAGINQVFSADSAASKRRILKQISYSIKGRAIFRFVYNFFVRSGWRDGVPGFHYCILLSMYEYWIEMKISELKN